MPRPPGHLRLAQHPGIEQIRHLEFRRPNSKSREGRPVLMKIPHVQVGVAIGTEQLLVLVLQHLPGPGRSTFP